MHHYTNPNPMINPDFERHSIYDLCNQHRGQLNQIQTTTGDSFHAFIDHVDQDNVYLTLSNIHPESRQLGGYGAYGYPGPGGGFSGYGYPGAGVGGFGGYGYPGTGIGGFNAYGYPGAGGYGGYGYPGVGIGGYGGYGAGGIGSLILPLASIAAVSALK